MVLSIDAIKKDYACDSVAIPPINANSGLIPERLWPFIEGIGREKQVQVEQRDRPWIAFSSTLMVGSTIFAVKPIISGPASTLIFIMLL
ncbi:MAG: hypothetical protein EB154_07060 [Nitrosopumilaceae archaeon]|nr:hypothetical protein [Nitrosopumilaceae archaeon]